MAGGWGRKRVKIKESPLRKTQAIREHLARVRRQGEIMNAGKDESPSSSSVRNLQQEPFASPAPHVKQHISKPLSQTLGNIEDLIHPLTKIQIFFFLRKASIHWSCSLYLENSCTLWTEDEAAALIPRTLSPAWRYFPSLTSQLGGLLPFDAALTALLTSQIQDSLSSLPQSEPAQSPENADF